MEWHNAVERIRPYVVRVDTPSGHGTGFLVHRSPGEAAVHIATALHVVKHAVEWKESIKLRHFASGKEIFLRSSDCLINTHEASDLAYIQFAAENLPLPEETIPHIQIGKRLKEGVQVGWCGYPFVAPTSLCFFTGHISSWLEPDDAYLVDGVAIHGVSGGPAFSLQQNGMQIIGLVTEYRPNYATGQALPGVSLIRSIEPFVQLYAQLEMEQMKRVKAEEIPQKATEQQGLNTGAKAN